jgi:hypothetical protein
MELTTWEIIGIIVLILLFLFILLKAIWLLIRYYLDNKE